MGGAIGGFALPRRPGARSIPALALCALFCLPARAAAPPAGQDALEEGHALYYRGEPEKAARAYERAARLDPARVEAWLNGGVVLEELGRRRQAVESFSRAAALSPGDPKILAALGWALLRARRLQESISRFRDALTANPRELYALMGLGRAELAAGRPRESAAHLSVAASLAPLNNLAHFWKGQSLEAAGDLEGAAAAYRRAAANDSYFVESRQALGRAYMRDGQFADASRQFARALDADPENKTLRSLRERVRGLFNRRRRPLEASTKTAYWAPKDDIEVLLPRTGAVPVLRVGVGTDPLGRPVPRRAVELECSVPFSMFDAKGGRALASGGAGQRWQLRASRRKSGPLFELLDARGRRALLTRRTLLLRPEPGKGGTTLLRDARYAGGPPGSGAPERRLRGELEFSWRRGGGSFQVVNLVDLESYTHGVLPAEMPIGSPEEALKAQSVVARSHALYIQTVSKRHKQDGYDLCDGEHCQVYAGASVESARSRAVVEATRGRVIAYQGRIALVLYSSNCGGHTQSGAEVSGWSDLHYWLGVPDAPPDAPPYPRSPWELRWWLRETPRAYCMPSGSGFVHPSHYRWTRVVPARELEEKLNRGHPVGRVLGLRALRRSRSGHLNSVLVVGERSSLLLTREISIRHFLGVGSQRSALFTVEAEYGPSGRPESFVFHGGGWGHGVGMCQSGAMGRAEQGQSYVDILKAYYRNTELGSLRY